MNLLARLLRPLTVSYLYEIQETGIRITLPFRSWLIKYHEITGLKKMSFFKAIATGMNPARPPMISFPGKLGAPIVVIETKNCRVAIVPTKADEFLRILSERINGVATT